MYDFCILFDNVNDKSLEEKWDTLHDKPLSEFKDLVNLDKIPTVDVSFWKFVATFMTLKPRGDIWKLLPTIVNFSKVTKISFVIVNNCSKSMTLFQMFYIGCTDRSDDASEWYKSKSIYNCHTIGGQEAKQILHCG